MTAVFKLPFPPLHSTFVTFLSVSVLWLEKSNSCTALLQYNPVWIPEFVAFVSSLLQYHHFVSDFISFQCQRLWKMYDHSEQVQHFAFMVICTFALVQIILILSIQVLCELVSSACCLFFSLGFLRPWLKMCHLIIEGDSHSSAGDPFKGNESIRKALRPKTGLKSSSLGV